MKNKTKKNIKRIGFIATTRLHLNNNDAAARDFFAVSPLFRYSLAYCERKYDEVYILSRGSFHLIHPDNSVSDLDVQEEYLSKLEKKNWVRRISNEMREFFPVGTELYFHTSNWHNLLFKWLKPDYLIFKPMKGKAIGKQLQFYKSQVGQLPSIKNKETKCN